MYQNILVSFAQRKLLSLASPSKKAKTSTFLRSINRFCSDFDWREMAAKIIANLIIMGSGILGRAVFQAYRKALENASKNGVAREAVNNIRRGKVMTEQEARQVLGLSEHASWEEVLQKYDTLFERNAKSGSFYLQSKVHRAKEALEAVYRGESPGTS